MKKKSIQIDRDEKDILAAAERGEFVSTKNLARDRKRYARIAHYTLAKNKSISIRISERDLMRLKMKAAEEGLPYQTLISSTLHKLVSKNL